MLVDAHCHYYNRPKQNDKTDRTDDVEPVISLYNSTKLDDIWNTCKAVEGAGSDDRQRLYVKKGLGIHPWYSHLYTLVPNISKTEHYQNVLQWKGRSIGTVGEGQAGSIEEDELRKMINGLPEPILLNDSLDMLLNKIDFIGEIGLDKTFRIPWNTNSNENKEVSLRLSNFTTRLEHQLRILEWWLKYANKHSLSIQLHSVKFYDQLLEVTKNQLLLNPKCKILLHGFQGSLDTLKRWERTFKSDRIYVSFNEQLNLRNNDHRLFLSYLEVLDTDHIFVETDSCKFDETTYDTIQRVTFILQAQSPNQKNIDFESNILKYLNMV